MAASALNYWEGVLNRAKALENRLCKPMTVDNVLFHYVPVKSCLDYNVLALSILNPKLVKNFSAW